MMPENFEKNMYLRHRQGKIILLWYPKNTDNLKSNYYDAAKILKKPCIYAMAKSKSEYYDTQKMHCFLYFG